MDLASSLNAPSPRELLDVAAALGALPVLVEKDWQVVRALRALANLNERDVRPVFSGGTSLSIAWGLIKRFSEDIDFKVQMPAAANETAARTHRRNYRSRIVEGLSNAGFQLTGGPIAGNESRYFTADFAYLSVFGPGQGLRPHLRLEMSFQTPILSPVEHSIQSLHARVTGAAPEIAAFPCLDPVETAADKLSALAWRVCMRQRGAEDDDPAMIRHLHDLAALESRIAASEQFGDAFQRAISGDAGRGGGRAPANARARLVMMLRQLKTDAAWQQEYEQFVSRVSFAAPDEEIEFPSALLALERIVARCGYNSN